MKEDYPKLSEFLDKYKSTFSEIEGAPFLSELKLIKSLGLFLHELETSSEYCSFKLDATKINTKEINIDRKNFTSINFVELLHSLLKLYPIFFERVDDVNYKVQHMTHKNEDDEILGVHFEDLKKFDLKIQKLKTEVLKYLEENKNKYPIILYCERKHHKLPEIKSMEDLQVILHRGSLRCKKCASKEFENLTNYLAENRIVT